MTVPAQMPQLVELSGPHAGRVHPLPYGEHVLGRGAGVGVRLDHTDISRRHARLEVSFEGVRVHDLGSKNGVRVDGVRLDAPMLLGHDAKFSLGDLDLRIVHPASQVTQALAAGGETTVTTDQPPGSAGLDLRSLLIPLGGVLLFGTLVAVMLLR